MMDAPKDTRAVALRMRGTLSLRGAAEAGPRAFPLTCLSGEVWSAAMTPAFALADGLAALAMLSVPNHAAGKTWSDANTDQVAQIN
jgi:hypothetical protein